MIQEVPVTPQEVEALTLVIGDKLQNVRATRDPIPLGEELMYRQISPEVATPLNDIYRQLAGVSHPFYLRALGQEMQEQSRDFLVPTILVVNQWVKGEIEQLCEKDERLFRLLEKLKQLKK